MADSKIEWTDATWNPTTGCTRASAGCDNCYAYTMTKRLAAMGQEKYQGLVGKGHFNGVLKTHDDELEKPLRWRKPRMLFVNSMSDLFHKDVPFEFIDKVFAVMALCPQHTFQVLTKRPERMAEYTGSNDRSSRLRNAFASVAASTNGLKFSVSHSDDGLDGFQFPNVWLGTSVENQQAADERIPHLLRCPAAVRFLSCEPLLSEIDLSTHFGLAANHYDLRGLIHWCIVGGESGHGARQCNLDWIESLVDQCKAAAVPCFVKQLGKNVVVHDDEFGWMTTADIGLTDSKGGDPSEWPADLRVRQFPAGAAEW